MKKWALRGQQPRVWSRPTEPKPWPPRRNVPPDTEPGEVTPRCPDGGCESRDRVRGRIGLGVSEFDSDSVLCYHCLQFVCVICGLSPVDRTMGICDYCTEPVEPESSGSP